MSLQQMQRTPWRLVSAAAQWHLTSQQEFLTAHVDRIPGQRVGGRTA